MCIHIYVYTYISLLAILFRTRILHDRIHHGIAGIDDLFLGGGFCYIRSPSRGGMGLGGHTYSLFGFIRPGTRGLFGDRPVLQAACFRGTTSGPGRFFHFFRQQPLAPLWMTSHVHPIRIATFLQTVQASCTCFLSERA